MSRKPRVFARTCATPFARVFVFAALGAPALAAAEPAVSPAPAGSSAAEATRTSGIRLVNTGWFLLAGDGSGAAPGLVRTARALEDALRAAGFPPPAENDRVTVYLKTGDGVPVVNTGGGRTSVIFHSGAGGDERLRAETLARAALCRIAQMARRAPAPAPWAVGALAWEVRLVTGRHEFSEIVGVGGARFGTALTTAPVYQEFLSRAAAAEGPAPLEFLDGPASAADAERHARQSFWLFRALLSATPGDRRSPLALASIGTSLPDTLRRCVPAYAAGGERAEAWWPAAFHAEVSVRISMAATPDESELRYAELTRFVIAEGGSDLALGFEGLISRRKDPSVDAAIRRRVVAFKTELQRANPVWFNAFLAYGLFLEKLTDAGDAELRALSLDAVAEARAAAKTSEEIRTALRRGAK